MIDESSQEVPGTDYLSMLNDIADEYPSISDKTLELRDDVAELLMPGDDEEPIAEPELNLDEPMLEEEELSL